MDLLNFRLFRTPRVGMAGDLRPAEMEGPLHKVVLEALATSTDGVKRAKDRVDDSMKTAPDLASGRSASGWARQRCPSCVPAAQGYR